MEEYTVEFSFTNPKMPKRSPPSMLSSKSFSLTETSITVPSLNATNNELKTETFHYSQTIMYRLPVILAMIFQDFKTAGNITLGRAKVSNCY